jgi:hypothetical protein
LQLPPAVHLYAHVPVVQSQSVFDWQSVPLDPLLDELDEAPLDELLDEPLLDELLEPLLDEEAPLDEPPLDELPASEPCTMLLEHAAPAATHATPKTSTARPNITTSWPRSSNGHARAWCTEFSDVGGRARSP